MRGIVKRFNPARGYGFITGDDGNDYFVHCSDVANEAYEGLDVGQGVAFDTETNPRGKRAVNVTILHR